MKDGEGMEKGGCKRERKWRGDERDGRREKGKKKERDPRGTVKRQDVGWFLVVCLEEQRIERDSQER